MNTLSNVIDAINNQSKVSEDGFKTLGELVSEGHDILKSVGDSMSFAVSGVKNPAKRRTFGANGTAGSQGIAEERRREESKWREELLDAIKALGAGGGVGISSDGGSTSSGKKKSSGGLGSWFKNLDGTSLLAGLGLSGVAKTMGPLLKRAGFIGIAAALLLDAFNIGKAVLDDDLNTEVKKRDIAGLVAGGIGAVIGSVFGPAGTIFGAMLGEQLGKILVDTFSPDQETIRAKLNESFNFEKTILDNKKLQNEELRKLGLITQQQYEINKEIYAKEEKRRDALKQQAKDIETETIDIIKASNERKAESLKQLEVINNAAGFLDINLSPEMGKKRTKLISEVKAENLIQDKAKKIEAKKLETIKATNSTQDDVDKAVGFDSLFEDWAENAGVYKDKGGFFGFFANKNAEINKQMAAYLGVEQLQKLLTLPDITEEDQNYINALIKAKEADKEQAKKDANFFNEYLMYKDAFGVGGDTKVQQLAKKQFFDNIGGEGKLKLFRLRKILESGDINDFIRLKNADQAGTTVNINNNNNRPVEKTTIMNTKTPVKNSTVNNE